MSSRKQAGFTMTELVVALAIGFIVIGLMLVLPALPHWHGETLTRTLSNMKQLNLATQQMALDGAYEKRADLGWPGDTGGTFTNWTAQLLKPNYLSTNELCKLLSAPGVVVTPPDLCTTNKTAVLVYAVREDSATNAVFLTSANFTNTPTGGILDPKAKPYGDKGFAIFRKDGDGAVMKPTSAGNTNAIGAFVPLLR